MIIRRRKAHEYHNAILLESSCLVSVEETKAGLKVG